MRGRGAGLTALFILALLAGGCASPDPKAALELTDFEAYWAIDSSEGDTHYLVPVARFRLRNKGDKSLRSAEVQANFKRKGEEHMSWGSGWSRVLPGGKLFEPGQEMVVVLKSDGRYYSTGPPEAMFQHSLFKDAKVEVFARVGSSAWAKIAEEDVERRIGSRSVQAGSP